MFGAGDSTEITIHGRSALMTSWVFKRAESTALLEASALACVARAASAVALACQPMNPNVGTPNIQSHHSGRCHHRGVSAQGHCWFGAAASLFTKETAE